VGERLGFGGCGEGFGAADGANSGFELCPGRALDLKRCCGGEGEGGSPLYDDQFDVFAKEDDVHRATPVKPEIKSSAGKCLREEKAVHIPTLTESLNFNDSPTITTASPMEIKSITSFNRL
jgi:hypothetical protein